jgi:gas vesicle protein GvpA/GvpJ/GvpM family
MRPELQVGNHRVSGLVDVLDRVLDKGLAIAGDIKISLAEVELLTIRIRLIVCSIDKAQEIGLDWWKYDEHFSPGKRAAQLATDELRKQLAVLEEKVLLLSANGPQPVARRTPRAKRK